MEGVRGPVARAGFPVYLPAGGRRCPVTNTPVTSEGSATSDPQGFVEGMVRNEVTGAPLPNASLQIIGTSYVTFSDGNGRYRLTFDAGLVDACRSQVVRVSAPGYRARTLVLALGRSDNTVPLRARQ
jgi:hypothetical protein